MWIIFCFTVGWRVIWNAVFKIFKIAWVMPEKCGQMMGQWGGINFEEIEGAFWNIMVFAVMWAIWLERNNQVFTKKHRPVLVILKSARDLAVHWVSLSVMGREGRAGAFLTTGKIFIPFYLSPEGGVRGVSFRFALQMFHLMPTPQGSFYVLNDIFRLNYA